jgi:hypothetical protein
MDESGVLDLADEAGFAFHYWHVMDTGKDSVDLLAKLLDRFGKRLRYVLVLNQLRGDDFSIFKELGRWRHGRWSLGRARFPSRSLNEATMQKIDATSSSFWAAKNSADKEAPASA